MMDPPKCLKNINLVLATRVIHNFQLQTDTWKERKKKKEKSFYAIKITML